MRFWLRKSLHFPLFGFDNLLMGYKWDTVSFLNRKLTSSGSSRKKRFDHAWKQPYDGSQERL